MDSLAHRTNNVADENTVRITNTGCTKTGFVVSFILTKMCCSSMHCTIFFLFLGMRVRGVNISAPPV